MTLCDAGPLLALIDHTDPAHEKCVTTLQALSIPLLSTWACFTEAMYLLGRNGGWPFQSELWLYRSSGLLDLHEIPRAQEQRMEDLMEQYRDTPMDLADASLVATAGLLGLRLIFTLDSDFRIYRTADGGTFEIVPD